MLENKLGIRLMLLAGATIPTPAPASVMSAITSVEVTNNEETGDGFQLSLTMAKGKIPDYTVLGGGTFNLFNRVIVAVFMGVMPEVLLDGVITNHQLSPSAEPGQSTLTLTGRDLTQMMDLEEVNERYPNQPDSVIVMRLLAGYARYGLIPEVTPTTEIPLEIDRVTRQAETDLVFIRRLAERNGFVFHIEPVTMGVSRAVWGSASRVGLPQPALSFNLGSATNVKTLNFTQDGLSTSSVQASFIEPFTRTVIPLPALPPLRVPPLALTPTPSRRVTLRRDTANQGAQSTAREMLSSITNQPDTVSASGTLDTARYGHVLRARKLVGLRGAGLSYDGNYYVKSVTHNLSRGEYTQNFTLSREGTRPLFPLVRP